MIAKVFLENFLSANKTSSRCCRYNPPTSKHCLLTLFYRENADIAHKRTREEGREGGREERGGGHFLLFTLARDFCELLLVLCSFPTW